MNIQGLTPRDQTMDAFDYNCEAELFTNAIKKSRRRSFGYRRFEPAGDPVRFAIEGLPPPALAGPPLGGDGPRPPRPPAGKRGRGGVRGVWGGPGGGGGGGRGGQTPPPGGGGGGGGQGGGGGGDPQYAQTR